MSKDAVNYKDGVETVPGVKLSIQIGCSSVRLSVFVSVCIYVCKSSVVPRGNLPVLQENYDRPTDRPINQNHPTYMRRVLEEGYTSNNYCFKQNPFLKCRSRTTFNCTLNS